MKWLLIFALPWPLVFQHFFVFGSSGLYCTTVSQHKNWSAGLAANCWCFYDQPLVKQRRQKQHTESKPETPRERKNEGQRAYNTHTHLQYVCECKDMYSCHSHALNTWEKCTCISQQKSVAQKKILMCVCVWSHLMFSDSYSCFLLEHNSWLTSRLSPVPLFSCSLFALSCLSLPFLVLASHSSLFSDSIVWNKTSQYKL